MSRIGLIVKSIVFVFKSTRWWVIINSLISVSYSILNLLQIYLIKILIDEISISVQNDKNNIYSIYIVILFAALVFILTAIIRSLSIVCREKQNNYTSKYVFKLIHDKSEELSLSFFDNAENNNVLYRARQYAQKFPESIGKNISSFFDSSVGLLIISGIIFQLHWIMIPVLIIAAIPGVLVRLKNAREIIAWKTETTLQERKNQYFHNILISRRFARELRLFNLFDFFKYKFSASHNDLLKERFAITKKHSGIQMYSDVSASIILIGILIFLVFKTLNQNISLGDLVLYFLIVQKGFDLLKKLFHSLASLNEDSIFAMEVFRFLEFEEQKKNIKTIEMKNEDALIAINNVSFRYDGEEDFVLRNVNLKIYKGEKIGLYGENAAGKTTLIKLISGLYHPTEGEIFINGQNILSIGKRELSKFFSATFQDYAHYYLSIGENIHLGNVSGNYVRENIEYAAKRAGLHNKIINLQNSYKQSIGKQFNNGVELSMGEYQKLANARALYCDANVLIFDEPTSSLDNKSEIDFLNEIFQELADKTVILISHKMSNLKLTDRIINIKQGIVSENKTLRAEIN